MQTHQVPPTPPQPRIATTHELMMPYAPDLVRMRAKGASHGQMLSWLHSQGVYANLAEIASFWSFHALQKQKMAPIIGPNIGKNPPGQPTQPPPAKCSGASVAVAKPRFGHHPLSTDLSAEAQAKGEALAKVDLSSVASAKEDAPRSNITQNSEAAPLPPGTPEWLLETDKNVQHLTAWFRDHAPADLGTLMNLYKSMLFKLLLKGDTSPESFQQVQQMTRTVISYEQNQTRLELRKETLNRQKAEPQPKASKPAKPPADQTADELPAAVTATPTISDLSAILSAIVSRQNPKVDGGNLPVTADLSESCRAMAQRATPDLSSVASAKEEASFTKSVSPATPTAKYPSGPTAFTTAPAGTVPPIPSG